jgi:hypothetical protein
MGMHSSLKSMPWISKDVLTQAEIELISEAEKTLNKILAQWNNRII